MSHVFISKSSEDDARAQLLAQALVEHGYEVWSDEKIPPGKEYTQVIEQALVGAGCVLVLWSKASVQSKWVKREASKADQLEKLVPVLIDVVADQIPLEFHLIQAADLARWSGDPRDPEFTSLLEAIYPYLGASQLISPEEAERLRNSLRVESAAAPTPVSTRSFSALPYALVGGALVLVLGGWLGSQYLAGSEEPRDNPNEPPVTPQPADETTVKGPVLRTVAAGDLIHLLDEEEGRSDRFTYKWRLMESPAGYPVQTLADLTGQDAAFVPAELEGLYDYDLVFEGEVFEGDRLRETRRLTLIVDCGVDLAALGSERLSLFGRPPSLEAWKKVEGSFEPAPDDEVSVLGVAVGQGRASVYRLLNRGEWYLSGRFQLNPEGRSPASGVRILDVEGLIAEMRLEPRGDGSMLPTLRWGEGGVDADIAECGSELEDGYLRFTFQYIHTKAGTGKLVLHHLGGSCNLSTYSPRPTRVELFVEGGSAHFADFELSGER